MRYYEKENLLFIHIPKTAGRTINHLLRTQICEPKIWYEKEHNILKDVIDYLPKDVNIISCIRNPHDRVVSFYAFLNTTGKKSIKNYPDMEDVLKMSFSDFVNWFIEIRSSQFDYLIINNELRTDIKLIRFENLANDLSIILNEELNLDLDLKKIPKLNPSNHKHWKKYYNKELYEKIFNKEKLMFDLKFYSREENLFERGKGRVASNP